MAARYVRHAAFAVSAVALLLPHAHAAGGSLRPQAPAPVAVVRVAESNFCFSRPRKLRPDLLPPSFLVARFRLELTYQNPGPRPLIVPLAKDRKVYMSLKVGTMNPLKQPTSLFDPSVMMMKRLPANVSPDNPIEPVNDVFTVIPAGAGKIMRDFEDVQVTVFRQDNFRKDPDLRGHRVYLRLAFDLQPIDPTLEATLSDRWASIGVPWTGHLLTNTLMFDIPATATGTLCVDKPDPPVARSPDAILKR